MSSMIARPLKSSAQSRVNIGFSGDPFLQNLERFFITSGLSITNANIASLPPARV